MNRTTNLWLKFWCLWIGCLTEEVAPQCRKSWVRKNEAVVIYLNTTISIFASGKPRKDQSVGGKRVYITRTGIWFLCVLGVEMPLENIWSRVVCSCVSVVCRIRLPKQFWHEVKATKPTMHWRVFSFVYIGQLQRLLWTNSKVVTSHKIFSRSSKKDTAHNIMLITPVNELVTLPDLV